MLHYAYRDHVHRKQEVRRNVYAPACATRFFPDRAAVRAALAVLAVLPRSWLNPAAMRREEHALCGLKVVVNAKRSKPLTP